MPQALANGIQLEYETFGSPEGRPLLLTMGLGGQLILWDEAFCEALADRGHYVVRYDNRDVGLSTKFEEAGAPDLMAMMLNPDSAPEPAYTLDDMAADGVGLLDALGLESAHVCGASMGGMIVQTMALRHAGRVRSMTSIMSTTGNKDLPPADPSVSARLMMDPPQNREEAIDRAVETFKVIGSPGFAFDEAAVRDTAARGYDRCFLPSGQARQLAAIVSQPNRAPELEKLDLPTLVVHGLSDPLVPVEGGKQTAAAIPGAELWLVEGMGHDLPKAIQAELVDRISALSERADG
ncbi:MAG: alpha/beta fold hydrolase [Myxococcota bacterium]|nr:alpha/beta fold hydrolase [Myxococcota bacterium]